MPGLRQLPIAIKALRQLGLQSVAFYGWYQLLLRTGYLRRLTPATFNDERGWNPAVNLAGLVFPDRSRLATQFGEHASELFDEAGEIVAGKVRLFGGDPVPLELYDSGKLGHWTDYEKGGKRHTGNRKQNVREDQTRDIKFTWEPGRFGWAFTLGRAYWLCGEERYAQAFWSHTETFLCANPVNMGPHWASAQEVALRLMAFAFASHSFARSPQSHAGRMEHLRRAMAACARRIPPTLAYARAQNNNHLLSEAMGLYTAACLLPDHPDAAAWRRSGWEWFQRGLQAQIGEDGSYIQQSTNYHRMMLQLAVWMDYLARLHGDAFSENTRSRLAAATRWLLALVDPDSGCAPNLGPNDGAYILPLSTCPFEDYRPTLQAAGLSFLGERLFPAGPWDEMSAWLGLEQSSGSDVQEKIPAPAAPVILRSPRSSSWAYLRAARFSARPGHADQLHLDLWWRGLNLAQDAGTYLYNAPYPWDNSLSGTAFHNTVTVNGANQMFHAGRFLWLDWAQAQMIEHNQAPDGSCDRLVARHDGYRRFGVLHQRSVERQGQGWRIEDELLPEREGAASSSRLVTARLHWLLPDWPWEIVLDDRPGGTLRLNSPYGWVNLRIRSIQRPVPGNEIPIKVQVLRAGEILYGVGVAPYTAGWVSPTYGVKKPALALWSEVQASLPFSFLSEWYFPE